jgi:preprotein translocase subunit SecF
MRPLKLVPDATNIPFLRYRNLAMTLSLLLIAGSIALCFIKGFNLGIDFIGGQMVRTNFAQPVNIEELRTRIAALDLGEPTIQQVGSGNEVSIRTPLPEGGDAAADQAARRVRAAIEQGYPGARVGAVESVSG